MVIAVPLLLAASAAAAALPAPLPQSPAPPAAASRHDDVAAPLAAGKAALAAGQRAEAARHFRRALDFAPDSPELWSLLVEACADDADARELAQSGLATASVTAEGKFALDGAARSRLPAEEERPAALAAARAAAVDELLRLAAAREREATSKFDPLVVEWWARRFALDLASASPALRAGRETEFSARMPLPPSLPAKVVKALESFASSAIANGRTADAIKAGRILAGMGTQLAFGKDLQGERPAGVGDLHERAAAILAKARERLTHKGEKPWTIDELLQLDGDQAEAFTREHDSFANPGVALSTQGWYRIETDCGFNTLLGVAQTIELHHQRLANWYGQDPFVGRPGLCRVVPEAAGLESEGSPFWWAGGFQSGDVTTLRFSCSSIEAFGHGLTHELTHRFDGAIYPGMPSWLVEGRAVWTGGAFGHSSDERFVEGWASVGTIEAAFIKGYGDGNKLLKLIEGTIDDYRDNYVAGFALYVYLDTFAGPGNRPLFKERLQKFMKESRGVRKWKEHFEQCFCDGRDGRPREFAEFVAAWAPWLQGFYWDGRKPWATAYEKELNHRGSSAIMDEPTWVWSRHRAEPRFGQDQAALAGRLLLAAGKRQDAIAAFVFALAVDGRRPQEEALLAGALEAEGRRDAAWVLRQTIEFPAGARIGSPPFASALPKVHAFAEQLQSAAVAAVGATRPVTAAAWRAERERVATWIGLSAPPAVAPIDAGKALCGFDAPARPLAPKGFAEFGLTDYEERRAKGRWYVDEEGDLHVGRDKPRDATGTVDRYAAQIHCFAVAPEWVLPGTWRLDARIRFTTSFVNGAVIFGYADRESNLRFSFSAGDFMYAIGKSQKEPEFNDMGWSITGLRDRDGGLPGSTSGGGFGFESRQSSFALTLQVDGALVEAFINGRAVGRYHTVDGAAIEGLIGFATSMGAIEVEDARVTRLERSRLAPERGFVPTVFDLATARSLPPWSSMQRTCAGLERRSQGTLLLWLAPPVEAPKDDAARAGLTSKLQWDLRELSQLVERMQPTQQIVVAMPDGVDEGGRNHLADFGRTVLGGEPQFIVHHQPFQPDGVEAPNSRRFLLFIDSAGIVRRFSDMPTGTMVADDDQFRLWLTVFRDHGRPKRELPEVERPKTDGAAPSLDPDADENGG
jgi:tetratricopeptide (TPR) repeat protein